MSQLLYLVGFYVQVHVFLFSLVASLANQPSSLFGKG